MLTINDLKTGAYLTLQGEPYVVVKHDFIKMAQSKGIMRVNLRNLKTGQVLDQTFKGQEKIEEADISRSKANYLYQDGQSYYFMDNSSYDQFFVSETQLGDKRNFLIENMEVEVLNYNGEPINIEVPNKVKLKVKQAPPGIRGDTAQGSVTKRVTLENGYEVDTPLFIKEGEIVEVNTETGKYVGKA
ncbi:MAG: elongation factor P [Patescibacteria group bacterium]|jgi:elongation factor P